MGAASQSFPFSTREIRRLLAILINRLLVGWRFPGSVAATPRAVSAHAVGSRLILAIVSGGRRGPSGLPGLRRALFSGLRSLGGRLKHDEFRFVHILSLPSSLRIVRA